MDPVTSKRTLLDLAKLLRANCFIEAASLLERTRYREAAESYELALKGLEDHSGNDHRTLCAILCLFGQLQCENNRHIEGQVLLNCCLAIMEGDKKSHEGGEMAKDLTTDDAYDYALCVESLANSSETVDQPEQAELMLRKALSFAQRAYGSASFVPVSIAVHLGMLYGNHDRYQEEIDLMLSALEFRQTHFGTGHQGTIYPLRGLAQANYLLRRNDEAVAYFEQAISVMEKERGAKDPRTIEFVQLIEGEVLLIEKVPVDEWAKKGVRFETLNDDKENKTNADDMNAPDTAPRHHNPIPTQSPSREKTLKATESNYDGVSTIHPSPF
ncbi:MAG: hypothetical protein Q9170_003112 [Blastenia crenularia]